jgi:tetratricopeptide (TPR) repeat protein
MMRRSIIIAAAIFALSVFADTRCLAGETKTGRAVSPASAEDVPNWEARWELARTLAYAKRYDESVAEYRKLLKERPGLTKARVEMAKILFQQKKDQDALAALEGVDKQQLDAGSLLVMADMYRDRKSYERAAALYRAYLAKRPDDHAARLRFAEMLSWEKHYDESLSEYRVILAALPDDVQVRRKYAMVLSWAKKYDESAKEFRRTLK